MENESFEEWFSNLKETNIEFMDIVDWPKIYEEIEKYRIELHMLNVLLNCTDIKAELFSLLDKYPVVTKTFPLLLAIQKNKLLVCDLDNSLIEFKFKNGKKTKLLEEEKQVYYDFLQKSKILNLIEEKKINNFYQYVLGVFVGLDSHARKNRVGTKMENLVRYYLEKIGLKKDSDYYEQIKLSKCKEMFPNINWDTMCFINNKIFDYLVVREDKITIIECNFYNANGSKLDSIAVQYMEYASHSDDVYKFLWITDGGGWHSSEDCLQNYYNSYRKNIVLVKQLEDNLLDDFIL